MKINDFSALTTNTARAFTLDDGTTTLVGIDENRERTSKLLSTFRRFKVAEEPNYVTITFVGTGLSVDVSCKKQVAIAVDGCPPMYVKKDPNIASQRVDVVSGLALGHHSVTFTT